MSAAPTSFAWFAQHEVSLAWRDFTTMLTGGRRSRAIGVIVAVFIAIALLHLLALGLVVSWADQGIGPDKQTFMMLSGFGLLFGAVMFSQALESVTRAYYARSDLELILSSPASAARLFAVRSAAVAAGTMALSCLLASPLINALALLDGAHWLAAYLVLAALGALVAALAVLVTSGLFALVGPKRTRFVAQILAAIVGAGFVVGIQVAAILHFGSYSRFTLFTAPEIIASAPPVASLVWLPARAAMGDAAALMLVIIAGLGALVATVAASGSSYARLAIAATTVAGPSAKHRKTTRFRQRTQMQSLRVKEWRLLARDPWLISQTLMQLLYLLPPAVLLWVNYGASAGTYVVVVPVLVMASGQLAGGLAWLAISGEDAHDLVVTAPISPRQVLRAKVESVLSVVGVILLPLLALIAFENPHMALVTAICAALATGSATAIQLWFRTVSRRALFRRRQTASRVATISEAFVSIMWAGTGALWAAGTVAAIAPAILALLIFGVARMMAPKRH
ncbi:hypothetical protein GCM10007989_09640 [Devosia pacifica]|uniref:Permease n=1 Tax=Devosia pacifica TaxID=1335967 RepID=A0A918VQZ0_9HYPH|nr:permease [Devosia pacifica]GHA16641.1 hypothetical protein GCM10007989_09640 [Devosia pacifica]